MNWIKTLWDKLVNKTSVTATPVEVEEVEEDSRPVGEIFAHMCRESGVKQRDLDNTNAVALFEEWYEGANNEEEIRAAIGAFKAEHAAVNAKFAGKL